MTPTVQRSAANPILTPQDIAPSRPGWVVECLLNPGAFEYNGKIGLLLRVAERPVQEEGWISTPLLDPAAEDGVRILRVRKGDPRLVSEDPRGFLYDGQVYLTTLSHLRLAWSDDGLRFRVEPAPALIGQGDHETYGIEDCRVTPMDGRYYLTYTAVSGFGHGVGLAATSDWRRFERHGMILPPPNKDAALFPEKIGGVYHTMHRPSSIGLGGSYIWVARSPDLLHWGDHRCIVTTRPGSWDSGRVGAGASPIRTDRGWLAIYHGANADQRYALGLLLLDPDDPGRVLARSVEPIMTPDADYERRGFFGNVVFTNGHVVRGDQVLLYYGASDTVIGQATLSLNELLDSLG